MAGAALIRVTLMLGPAEQMERPAAEAIPSFVSWSRTEPAR
jgi:hypothetical protein